LVGVADTAAARGTRSTHAGVTVGTSSTPTSIAARAGGQAREICAKASVTQRVKNAAGATSRATGTATPV
jgi:hypothetical protein